MVRVSPLVHLQVRPQSLVIFRNICNNFFQSPAKGIPHGHYTSRRRPIEAAVADPACSARRKPLSHPHQLSRSPPYSAVSHHNYVGPYNNAQILCPGQATLQRGAKLCSIEGITDFRRKTSSGLFHSRRTVSPHKGKMFRHHRGLCLYGILAGLHCRPIIGSKSFRLLAFL